MTHKAEYQENAHGFTWGSATVTRLCQRNGVVVLRLSTARLKCGLQIYVTRTGKVRISSDDGEWFAEGVPK